ncbi:hypothetical protein JHK82_035193 [Glycine max]|nr:hypothetical protein JHK85_035915 [Glycine max]KAG5111924.1 hypothetical protein JHK82_035193 [Glycine max]
MLVQFSCGSGVSMLSSNLKEEERQSTFVKRLQQSSRRFYIPPLPATNFAIPTNVKNKEMADRFSFSRLSPFTSFSYNHHYQCSCLDLLGLSLSSGLHHASIYTAKDVTFKRVMSAVPAEMVVQGWSVSPLEGAAFGVLCFLLLSCSFPFWFVVQTAFYFVCKSYHNENIDKSALADRLEGYANNGSPDVQLKQNQV